PPRRANVLSAFHAEAGTEPLVEAEHDTRRAADQRCRLRESPRSSAQRLTDVGRLPTLAPRRPACPTTWQLRLRLNRRRRRCSDGLPARIATRFCIASRR